MDKCKMRRERERETQSRKKKKTRAGVEVFESNNPGRSVNHPLPAHVDRKKKSSCRAKEWILWIGMHKSEGNYD